MTAPRSVRNTQKHRRQVTLERMESRELLAVFSVTNAGDSGPGTLRQAITDVNSSPGSNVIQFVLPLGTTRIAPTTMLPDITNSDTTLDGTTRQPGYNGKPIVVLDGSNAPTQSTGLTISGGNSTVRGLVIQNWGGAGGVGIKLKGGSRDIVQNCYIGTDAAGLSSAANGDGIDIANSNNTIGGTTSATRNVISGNTFDNVHVSGFNSTGNVIQGNYIGVGSDGIKAISSGFTGISLFVTSGNQIGGSVAGAGNVIGNCFTGIQIQSIGNTSTTIQGNFIGTDASGTIAEPNLFDGIDLISAGKNVIGGPGLARNVISGNGRAGISIQGAQSKNNLITNNYIGVAANGVSPLGNATEGILVNGVFNEVIGGLTPANGNVIAYNGGLFNNNGINVISSSGVQILSNLIYANVGGGIQISNGSNNNQPAPLLAGAESGAGQTNVTGSLSASPNTLYIVQYFTSQTGDKSGSGQAETLLGSMTVTTDDTGVADISTRLIGLAPVGSIVTATATEPVSQSSSGFSKNVTVTAAPVTNLDVTINASPSTALLGGIEAYTVTVKNSGPNDATGVTVSNQFDTNSTILDTVANPLPSGSVIDPQNPLNVITTIGNLANGASVTYTIYVTPNDVGVISLTSTASNLEIDANSSPMATATLTVNPAVDIVTTLNSQPSPVPVGSPVTYIVTLTNNGPSLGNNITATITLPANAPIDTNSISESQGTLQISPDGLTLTYFAGSLVTDSSATLTFQLATSTVGTVTVSASTISDEAELKPADNSATLSTDVDFSTDLAVSFSPTPSPAFIGQNLTYVVTVTNNGPSDATGVLLTDLLPANVTFVSAVSSQGAAPTSKNGSVVADLGTIANGQSATITIIVTPTTSGTLSNVATVSNTASNELDPDVSNNTATTPDVQVSPVNVNLSLSATPNPVAVGGDLTYVITVSNTGPAPASNVTVQDILPTGVTIASIVASQGTSQELNGIVTANLGTIAVGEFATLTIIVNPTASAKLINQASLINVDEVNNGTTVSDSATTLVSPSDLAVGLSASTTDALVGSAFTYTLTLSNNGPSDDSNVLLSQTIPSNLKVTNITSTDGTASYSSVTGSVTLSLSTVASGTTVTVTITVVPTAIGDTTTSNAAVTGDNFDPTTANNSASTVVSVTNLPGTFEVASTSYSVSETGGFATITINRTQGTLGTVVLLYNTANGTAKAGVNYGFTSGAVVFVDGQTSAVVTVPVFHDGQITPNLNFSVVLSGTSSGGGLIGAQDTTNITIVNVDRDTIAPQVTAIAPTIQGSNVTGFVIAFSESIDPSQANLASNYAIFLSGRDVKPGTPNTPIGVASAVYDDVSHTVTITSVVPLAIGKSYGIAVNGTTGTALRDLAGNLLSGNGSGVAGSDYDSFVAVGTNLTYIDANGNTVNLKLSGGGFMILTRFANGQANQLQVVGAVAHKSALTGSVQKTKKIKGSTTINRITGLGKFGDVRSSLTTPGFYVLTQPTVPSLVKKK